MRALVASCVFPPEPVISAKTSSDIASFLGTIGYETTVICPQPSRNFKATTDLFLDPVKTRRLFSIKSERSTFLSRFIENVSFGVSAFFHILFSRKYDVLYSNVWPLFATGLVILAAKIKGTKVILSIQDLYPESLALQSRITSKSLVYRLLFKIDKLISVAADHIIVISEKFHQAYNIERNVPPSKLSIIPNWIDAKSIIPIEKRYARKQLANITKDFFEDDNSFYIVYGGNIGVASGLDMLPKLIQCLPHKFKFLIAGDGSLLKTLTDQIGSYNASEQVFFFSPWPENYTSIVFSAADLLFLPTAPGQSLASVPSKLITYMLAERPILAIVNETSDTSHEIQRSQGGFICSSFNTELIAKSIICAANVVNEDLVKMGENSRNYAVSNYSFESAKSKLMIILKQLYEN